MGEALPIVCVALAACAGSGGADTGPTWDPGDTASWQYQADIATAQWSAEDAGAAITAAVANPFPVPQSLMDLFQQIMAEGDTRCPGSLSMDQILGCTSDSDWWYAGISGYSSTDVVDGATPFTQDDLYADMQVLAPDGSRFAIGGSAFQHLGSDAQDDHLYSGFLQGIFIRTKEGSIFDPAVDALLTYTAGDTAGAAPWVTLDGAVGYADTFLKFDDMTINGATCPTDAVGTVRIRDTTDHWYSLELGDSCTGCGEVYFNGTTDLGEACVALSSFGGRLSTSLLAPWR